MIFVVIKCYNQSFFTLCFGFMSSLLCKGVLLCALILCIGFVLTSCRGCILCGVLSGDSRNPSRGEGRDVKLGARTLKHILVFAFGYLSINSTLFISCIAIIVHLYMFGIVLVFTLVLIQESY